MAYADVSLIVEGSLAEEHVFYDAFELDQWATDVIQEAKQKAIEVQAFVLWHEHDRFPDGADCGCAQFKLDHKPEYSYSFDDLEEQS